MPLEGWQFPCTPADDNVPWQPALGGSEASGPDFFGQSEDTEEVCWGSGEVNWSLGKDENSPLPGEVPYFYALSDLNKSLYSSPFTRLNARGKVHQPEAKAQKQALYGSLSTPQVGLTVVPNLGSQKFMD